MNISFLLGIFCFILNPSLGFGGKPKFLDLSLIDYKVIKDFGGHKISIFRIPDSNFKIICSSCKVSANNEITCKEGDLVRVEIEMDKEKIEISPTFNILCKAGNEAKNLYQIQDIQTQVGINNISLSFMQTTDEIIRFYFYFFNETNSLSEHIRDMPDDSYFLSNLKERTWYQFCIAATDVKWGTGRYVCKQMLTDFSVTGPVTNASAKSESEKIFISWSLPQYEHDIPQAYVVHLKGPHNFCKIVIIKMVEVDIPNDEKCLNNFTTLWSSLKTLEIKGLDPNSEFQIEIIPFNRNKKCEKTSLSIKTKEGESGAVEGLSWDTSSPGYLHITFKEPRTQYGKISKYRIKITSIKIDICTKKDAYKYETYATEQFVSVELSVLKYFGLYLIEVSLVNGWDQNSSLGKPASIPYEHFPAPGIVKLGDLKSGFMKNQDVSWSYSGSDECLRFYRVEYWEKYTEKRNYILASRSSTELKNLKINKLYVVKVRAEGLMKTINNVGIGKYSPEKQFYTGDTELELAHYNHVLSDSSKSLHITWGLKQQMRGSIFEFLILVKNSSGMCQSLIRLTCGFCDEPINQVYLSPEQSDKRQNLLKCKLAEKKQFQSEDINFNDLVKFKNHISNFTVEIYGTNLMGVHLLIRKSGINNILDLGKIKFALIITMNIFLMFLVIALLIYCCSSYFVVVIGIACCFWLI